MGIGIRLGMFRCEKNLERVEDRHVVYHLRLRLAHLAKVRVRVRIRVRVRVRVRVWVRVRVGGRAACRSSSWTRATPACPPYLRCPRPRAPPG